MPFHFHHLGIIVCVPHTYVCGTKVDELGHHGLRCKKSVGRYARHAMVNDLIKRALITCKIPAIVEPTGRSRLDGKKPEEITLVPRKMVDPCCGISLAPTH